MFCFDAGSGYCVAYRPAAEGSPCGDGQVSRRYLDIVHNIDRKQLYTAIVVYSRSVSSSPVATLRSSRGASEHIYNKRSCLRGRKSHAINSLRFRSLLQHCTNGKCITEHENIIPDFSQNTPAYLRRMGDEGEATQDWPQYLSPNVTTQR